MAVAAYASVLSLMHVLDNVLHPSRRRFLADTSQIQTLQESLASLLDFLEVHHSKITEETEHVDLAREIPNITEEADDIIDDYMLGQIIRRYHGYQEDTDLFYSFCRRIEGFDGKINSIKQKLWIQMGMNPKVVEDRATGSSGHQKVDLEQSSNDQKLKGPIHDSPSEVASNHQSSIVGLEQSLIEIKLKLTGDQQNLQVIPIVGMPGLGKTTLAKYAFHDQLSVETFDKRIWVTVSQEFDLRQTLKRVLDDGIIDNEKNETSNLNASELGLILYQWLFGRKYLVVLDDVWSVQAWDDLRRFFPDNANGSRVVVTTRLSDVANSLGPRNTYSMEFLDEENSWDLFSERAFARGNRSPELVEIGKKIARNCRGLPLSLVVVGGLLANSDMTPSYWELVSKNVSSFANSGNDENCLKVLSLSYDYLPIHLKPCFLYMAVFGEDREITVSELVKMWMAEGFLKPARDEIPEEVALGYLEDLIGRNIVEIRERGSRGNIKICGIHDLVRDLCSREYLKEDLFGLPRMQEQVINSHENLCSFCAKEGEHESIDLSVVNLSIMPLTSSVRSLVCRACRIIYPQLSRIRFVRMIDTIEGVPARILQTTKARYLRMTHLIIPVEFADPSSMTLLWNLQTLRAFTFEQSRVPVPDIWDMPLLRHVNVGRRMLSDPNTSDDFTVLECLQTLKYVSNFRCTEEVVRRIPNLKKLGLTYEWSDMEGSEVPSWYYYRLYNLHLLQKLESLSLRFIRDPLMICTTYPYSLKKLSLFECYFHWEDINTVGLLPNLEVLKLNGSVIGWTWSPPEERFLRLKHLKVKGSMLMQWIADETHFPVLEDLILVKLFFLESIPSGFGNIDALRSITLDEVSDSAVDSAREMIEEKRSDGDESLRLHLLNPVRKYY